MGSIEERQLMAKNFCDEIFKDIQKKILDGFI